MQEDQSKSLVHVVGALFMLSLIVLVVFLIMYTNKSIRFVGKTADIQNTISVTGNGDATAIPDIMFVTLGFDIERSTVEEAQEEHTEKMNELMNQLKQLNIAEEDIKTTSYNVYPQYNYFPERERELRGYTVASQAQVKIRDFDIAGDVLKLIGKLGVNQVHGLQFDLDDPDDVTTQARNEAIEEAKSKAQDLAKTLGVKLGPVVGFNEYSADQGYPIPYAVESRDLGVGGFGGAAPTVAPGENEVNVNVTLTYEIY